MSEHIEVHASRTTRPHDCAICRKPIEVGEMAERYGREIAHVACAIEQRRFTNA